MNKSAKEANLFISHSRISFPLLSPPLPPRRPRSWVRWAGCGLCTNDNNHISIIESARERPTHSNEQTACTTSPYTAPHRKRCNLLKFIIVCSHGPGNVQHCFAHLVEMQLLNGIRKSGWRGWSIPCPFRSLRASGDVMRFV